VCEEPVLSRLLPYRQFLDALGHALAVPFVKTHPHVVSRAVIESQVGEETNQIV
jgi:hypothetical protein